MAVKLRKSIADALVENGIMSAEQLQEKINNGDIILTGVFGKQLTPEEMEWSSLAKELRNEFMEFLRSSEAYAKLMERFKVQENGEEYPQVDLLIRGKKIALQQGRLVPNEQAPDRKLEPESVVQGEGQDDLLDDEDEFL